MVQHAMTSNWRGAQRTRSAHHEPQVARADDALLQHGVSGAQQLALTQWLSSDRAQKRHGDDPDRHTIQIVPAAWAGLPGWPSELGKQTSATSLSRGRVFELAEQTYAAGEWLPLLVGAYAWGQGTNGYGPHRLAKILGANPDKVEVALQNAILKLQTEGSVEAYRALRGTVKWLGPAFFTKFLYFAGRVTPRATAPSPLILDGRVASSLRGIAEGVYANADLPDPGGLAAWLWPNAGWSPNRYGVYLDWAQKVTVQLHAASAAWPVRLDLLELALFDPKLDLTSAAMRST
jgi:hypothetical protein